MDLKPSKHLRPFPKFSKPYLEGAFSIDRNRIYQNTFSNLKYLKIPSKINFDLNRGDDDYVDKPSSAENEQITQLLNFILHNKDVIRDQKKRPDFICFRGLLRLLMSTPYEPNEQWIVIATKFKNTIYLCSIETQLKKAEKMRRTARDIKFCRFGFKFENCVLSHDPSKPAPGSSQPVIEAEEFCAMYSAEIDGKKILYGAEMDGVIGANGSCQTLEELRKLEMVEVKVKRRENNERQLTNFYRFKARNWFLQSFLVGIDKIFVGIRNDEGIVNEVKTISTKELSGEAKQYNYWHGTVAANFLNDFLKKVAKDMKNVDDARSVYRYQYDTRVSDFVTHQQVDDGRKFAFLTPEYITTIESIFA